jgi:glyceraldehyde 3-phosphate dehydrogenase
MENEPFTVTAINDITSIDTLAHLLKYDTVFRQFPGQISVEKDHLVVRGKRIRVFCQKDPAQLPWKDEGINLVVESTGLFRKRPDAAKHITAGAAKVIISAPATDPDITLVMGVNDHQYDHQTHHIISNASCTTNCVAPVAQVLHTHYGIVEGNMTTVHSYTNDQRVLDLFHKDLRRARAAAQNIIPTTTGAAKALGLVIPALKGKISGSALRVPTPNVSLIDLVVTLEKEVTLEEMKKVFRESAEKKLKGILGYSEEPLVSSDLIGNENSAVVDADFITVIGKRMAKLLAWYDNEWGYASRIRDLIRKIVHETG